MARLAKAAEKGGNLKKLLEVSTFGSPDSDSQAVIRAVYDDLLDDQWDSIVPNDHPGKPLADLLADPEKSRYMTDDDRAAVREHLTTLMLADTSYLDPAVTREVGRDATVAVHKEAAKAARAKALPKREMPSSSRTEDVVGWLKEFTQNLVQAVTGGKPKDGLPAERDHKPGEIWKTEEGFGAKSPQGETQSFPDRDSAQQFAQGLSKQGAVAGWDFTPWPLPNL